MRLRWVVGWSVTVVLLVSVSAAAEQAAPDAAAGGTSNLPGGLAALPLLQDISIHGSFDVNYERRDYTDDPTDGRDVLRNYHHFIFIDRHSKDDGVFLSAEVVDLTFYEFGYRPDLPTLPFDLTVKGGKILVPFGPEPLFHHMYGGLSGFDQEILPTVWAQLGATANAHLDVGGVSVSNDFYLVRGYAVDAPDEVVNLSGGFSDTEDVRIGWGDRLAASFGPVTVWYSLYLNNLGSDQRLFMQAIDATIWRPSLPVLEDVAISVGAMRADVFVAESPDDYFHFGDYLQIRYYAKEWLYLQFRTGLRTFDNRSHLYYDDGRADTNDSTAHSVGIVYSDHGFTIGLHHFWRLEKTDERPNDFLRLAARYDF